MVDWSNPEFWILIFGFIVAFILAFNIGANDVANTFGTSVGAKVLTLKQACILATIFETLGSILLGARVSGTIRSGIMDPLVFQGQELELMLGYISALLGCCIWLFIATMLRLPISGTHSIVGATIGMAIVSKGFGVIKWWGIGKIAASWVISPLLSGLISVVMFLIIRRFILKARNPLEAGLALLPLIYTITVFINVGGILESAPPLLRLDLLVWWHKIIVIAVISLVVYLCVWLLVAPFLRKKINPNSSSAELTKDINFPNSVRSSCSSGPDFQKPDIGTVNFAYQSKEMISHVFTVDSNDQTPNPCTAAVPIELKSDHFVDTDFRVSDPSETKQLFSYLQILTAIFGSFAHGGNDVSNAIGPLIGLFLVYNENKVASQSETPVWILLYGGVGISIGLCVLGRRVIKTIGEDLTKITPSSGFVIELSSAITVLGASLINIPISSTHCKVGSVVFTGQVRAKESVSWSLFRNIGLAWALTLPITAALAAVSQVILKLCFSIPL